MSTARSLSFARSLYEGKARKREARYRRWRDVRHDMADVPEILRDSRTFELKKDFNQDYYVRSLRVFCQDTANTRALFAGLPKAPSLEPRERKEVVFPVLLNVKPRAKAVKRST